MRLTKKKAIEITIELWEWLAETGSRKGQWSQWVKYGSMRADCPLCEYSRRGDSVDECKRCPLQEKYPLNGCYDTAYDDWEVARTEKGRQRHAKRFLGQLRLLLPKEAK